MVAVLATIMRADQVGDGESPRLWIGPPITAESVLREAEGATHQVIHSADAQWQYLHGVSLATHDGQLVASWENGHEVEHDQGCSVRGRWARGDDRTWTEPFSIESTQTSDHHRSHGVMWTEGDILNLLVTMFERKGYKNDQGQWAESGRPGYQLTYQDLQTEQWRWDPDSAQWLFVGPFVSGVFPSGQPKKLPGGSGWVMGAFDTHGHPTVVRWPTGQPQAHEIAKIPVDVDPDDPLRFGETDVLVGDDRLIAITRYQTNARNNPGYGLLAESKDGGATWTTAHATDFPMAAARPCVGRLSTGEPYLIFNPWDRNRLAIATGPAGGVGLDRLLLLRDSPPPTPQFPAFARPQWSYPSAVEHGEHLLVAYSASKEDAVLTAVPLRALRERVSSERSTSLTPDAGAIGR